jgi:acetyl-CoA carboxylase biotin carboxyl carrier protein
MADKVDKLDTSLIRELANILTDGNLGEIEVEHGDLRIRVSMPEPVVTSIAAPLAAPIAAPAAPAAAPVAETLAPAAAAVPANAVKAPMVGTAYLSAEPGAAPFVSVGDQVSQGQTLLLVEAMKTFNPVTATSAGTVKEILVTDGQPVEYGEALVVVA